jgi:FO synthase
MSLDAALSRAAAGEPLSDDVALHFASASPDEVSALMEAAATARDRAWGRDVTFSPKVFLPLTNLCRNYCSYCSFRRSPGQPGEWTMSPAEVDEGLDRARQQGCIEALFCLGDTPETAFPSYRATLNERGFATTVDSLYAAGRAALDRGLLPHTNAGILSAADMERLKEVNVSLGLMLECVSERLCEPGMPHHRAPDKRPERRLGMIAEAGVLRIPFTTGILLGIGETRRERVESLLAIRKAHREHGHIQEVIVQSFRAHPGTAMRGATDPGDEDAAHAVALARLILDPEVSVQAPPNLSPGGIPLLLRAGINDLGGISPVTPDYINPRHPWPHLEALADSCARAGHRLRPRLPIYDAYVERPGALDDGLRTSVRSARERLSAVVEPWRLVPGARQDHASERCSAS